MSELTIVGDEDKQMYGVELGVQGGLTFSREFPSCVSGYFNYNCI